MTEFLGFALLGYLLGSLPFGLIFGRLFKGVDVRDHGSGATGMTNVLRTVGIKAAILVLILDMSKSVIAILGARLITESPSIEVAAGVASMIGHIWPIFSGFRGGKGVAPGWSGLFPLSPICGIVATLVGVPIIILTRYVSLGSIIGAISGTGLLVVLSLAGQTSGVYAWYGFLGGIIVIARHKDNLSRLVKGNERRLDMPKGIPTIR